MGDYLFIKHGIGSLLGYVLRHTPEAMHGLTTGLEALGEAGRADEDGPAPGMAEISRDVVTLSRLLKRAREEVFDDPGIAMAMGREAWGDHLSGRLWAAGSGPGGKASLRILPGIIQEILGPLAGSEVHDLGPVGCSLSIRWLAPVGADICQFFQGAVSSLPRNWQSPDIKIKEVDCQFEGSDACRFVLSWPRPSWRSRLMLKILPSPKTAPQPEAVPAQEPAEPVPAPKEPGGIEQVRQLLDEAAEAVYLLDFEGRVTYANVMAMGMFGQFSKRETISDILPQGLVDWDEELRPLIQKRGRLLKEVEFTAMNGEVLLLGCKAQVLGPGLMQLSFKDNSLAAKVKKLSSTLQQAGTLTLTLNQPLMSLMASAELLGMRSDPDTIARMSEIIVTETKRLAEMIQELGEISNSEIPGAVKRIR